MKRGEQYTNPSGRTIEILAVDTLGAAWLDDDLDVVAYRFIGGSVVHLETVEQIQLWERGEVG